MTEYYCKTCMHRFRLKTDYDKHLSCCQFFSQIRKNKMELDELGTKLPTQKELYLLVRHLTLTCERLEQKVKRLEENVGKKQRILIMDLLNHRANTPTFTFRHLYNMCTVSRADLLKVYNNNLTEGIKQVLMPVLSGIKERSPVRAFSQKKRQIYVFDIVDEAQSDVPAWSKMTNLCMGRAITHISQLFLKEHIKWENEQDELSNSSGSNGDFEYIDDDMFEKSIRYRKKVNGTGIVANDQNRELRDWLYDTIEETLKQICEIEFE